jgi:hypothetical protein
MISQKLLGTSTSVHHLLWPQRLFRGKSYCFAYALPISHKFLFGPKVTYSHRGNSLLRNVASFRITFLTENNVEK